MEACRWQTPPGEVSHEYMPFTTTNLQDPDNESNVGSTHNLEEHTW